MDLYDFPFEYRGLTLNEHRTAAGALDATKLGDTIRVNAFDFSRLQQRDQREALHLLTGGDLGDATHTFRFLSLSGVITAPTGARLSDKISALNQVFNVEQAQLDDPDTTGVSALAFTDVTEVASGQGTAHTDPVTGLSAGEYIKERFYARPAAHPIVTQRRSGGDAALFAVELVCPDPRRYIDTAKSVVLNSGNSFSAACANWNAAMGVLVHPILTLVMTGNGSATLTINAAADARTGLILNMAAAGAGTFTVDCYTGRIQKNGVDRADLRTSVVDTYPVIVGGGDTINATDTTNVTSITISYRQARG